MRQHAVRAWDGMVTRLRHRLRTDPAGLPAIPLAWAAQPMGARIDLADQHALQAALDADDPAAG